MVVVRPGEQIASRPFFVTEAGGRPVGFYGLSGSPPVLTLDHLFVLARHIGTELEVEPNAEAFYGSRGAVRVGEVRASIGRWLPLMRARTEYVADLAPGQ